MNDWSYYLSAILMPAIAGDDNFVFFALM